MSEKHDDHGNDEVDNWHWIMESGNWPQSVQVYKGVIHVNVFGKNREDAQVRLEQFNRFLNLLTLSEDGESHPSTLFVQPSWDGEKPEITSLYQEETFASADELRPSMASGDMPQWSVIRYDAPDGYDPDGLAESIMNPDEDES